MKLLLINPNTSAHVTDRMVAAAQRTLGPHATVTGVTAASGPAIVGSRSENALAAASALELAAAHAQAADAVVLAISTDAGLDALREMLEVPVAGMLEAALFTAAQLGGRIGLMTLGARMLPLYQERAQLYGIASRVCAWHALELPAAYAQHTSDDVVEAVAGHALQLVRDNSLDVLVLSGAVLAGYREAVARRLPVPVIDGTEAACWQAFALAKLRPIAHQCGSFARPSGRTLVGISSPLADWLR